MAYYLIEVKMFSSVGNKPNLANITSRLHGLPVRFVQIRPLSLDLYFLA